MENENNTQKLRHETVRYRAIENEDENHIQKNHIREIQQVYETARQGMPSNAYHNFRHAEDVLGTARHLARLEGIASEDTFVLETAALLHDYIFVIGARDNEERTAEFARAYLPAIGYSAEQASKVSELVLATKVPTKPKSLLEQVICDADVDNLGREDFIERSEEIRKEAGVEYGAKWLKGLIGFLESHKYYTKSAQELRNEGVKANIAKLKKMMEAAEC